MHSSTAILIGIVATMLAACGGGNVTSARDYDAPRAPPVLHPLYDPNMPYGSANATWAAPIHDRRGTIVGPRDPSADTGRQPYEQAPWATGAAGRDDLAPPGTF
jgi:hypothetical protein